MVECFEGGEAGVEADDEAGDEVCDGCGEGREGGDTVD